MCTATATEDCQSFFGDLCLFSVWESRRKKGKAYSMLCFAALLMSLPHPSVALPEVHVLAPVVTVLHYQCCGYFGAR
jgi:hypothetical protein